MRAVAVFQRGHEEASPLRQHAVHLLRGAAPPVEGELVGLVDELHRALAPARLPRIPLRHHQPHFQRVQEAGECVGVAAGGCRRRQALAIERGAVAVLVRAPGHREQVPQRLQERRQRVHGVGEGNRAHRRQRPGHLGQLHGVVVHEHDRVQPQRQLPCQVTDARRLGAIPRAHGHEILLAQHAAGEAERGARQVLVVAAGHGQQHPLPSQAPQQRLVDEVGIAHAVGGAAHPCRAVLAHHAAPHHAIQVGHQQLARCRVPGRRAATQAGVHQLRGHLAARRRGHRRPVREVAGEGERLGGQQRRAQAAHQGVELRLQPLLRARGVGHRRDRSGEVEEGHPQRRQRGQQLPRVVQRGGDGGLVQRVRREPRAPVQRRQQVPGQQHQQVARGVGLPRAQPLLQGAKGERVQRRVPPVARQVGAQVEVQRREGAGEGHAQRIRGVLRRAVHQLAGFEELHRGASGRPVARMGTRMRVVSQSISSSVVAASRGRAVMVSCSTKAMVSVATRARPTSWRRTLSL